MCELNYRGTKIEIGIKLGDQKCNFTYKKNEAFTGTTQTLTCDINTWHSTSEVNSQRPNRAFRINFAGIYKIGRPNL